MNGDYSRWSHDARKDDAAVLLQQGRLLTDDDWNTAAAVAKRRTQVGTLDVVGRSGVPSETPDGFKVTLAGTSLTIGPGRAYVDGILAENHGGTPQSWQHPLAELAGTGSVAYSSQPHLPQPPPLPTAGRYLVYLKVWRREVTSVDDPSLVEPALGVDTTTRHRTVWQVKTVPVPTGYVPGAPFLTQPWFTSVEAPATSRLTVGTATADTDPDPCLIAPTGGYTGVENQLYRVQVHRPGPAGTATFTWSRDNATVAARVVSVGGALDRVVVDRLGHDRVLSFHEGEWVELLDEARELAGTPGVLRRIKTPGGIDTDTGTIVFESPLVATDFALDSQGRPVAGSNLRVRRWDQGGTLLDEGGNAVVDPALATGSITIPGPGTKLVLEHGITVGFSSDAVGGVFRTGDHWLVPARTADPTGHVATAQPALGVHAHYAGLAVVDGGTVVDVRPVFPPLSGMESLFYVAGDGQEVTPDTLAPAPVPLPVAPRVGVSRGPIPVSGRSVRFTLVGSGSGTVNGGSGPVTVATTADGTAAVQWAVDPFVLQTLEARLLDWGGNAVGLPVRFSARTRLASKVAYQPGACSDLSGVATVQEALDTLCLRGGGSETAECCATVGEGGDYATLEEALRDLAERREGIACVCLLPGEHRWDGSEIDYLRRLDVHGCGATLHLATPLRLHKLEVLELSDLDLVGAEDLSDGLVLVAGCIQVTFHGLRVRTDSPELPVLVHLFECGPTRIRDCAMRASHVKGEEDSDPFTGPVKALLEAARTGSREELDRLVASNRRAAVSRREHAADQLVAFDWLSTSHRPSAETLHRIARLIRDGASAEEFEEVLPEIREMAAGVDAVSGIARAAIALERMRGAVWVVSNDLAGGISTNGVASPDRIEELEERLEELVEKAEDPPSVETGPARLDLHQNRFAWLLDAGSRDDGDRFAWASARIGENVVDSGPVELVAGRVSVSGNDLSGRGKLVGILHANQATATANTASVTGGALILSSQLRDAAANLGLHVRP
ncbi:hypothetical protein EXE58_15610 [Nocardioides seonyuensis]|uniref:Uncharacterized protein n=1 Tax=Nocardioides seonyuensis TaxID=2518371 RepID=A0A4P7IJ10_9ACTN|nr:DUF6519 domain-containing protein [Nocardioides seonyuensis]QBX56743.1 hypothetical protein EXE58_15610 [Nocardioides seonyuensis]